MPDITSLPHPLSATSSLPHPLCRISPCHTCRLAAALARLHAAVVASNPNLNSPRLHPAHGSSRLLLALLHLTSWLLDRNSTHTLRPTTFHRPRSSRLPASSYAQRPLLFAYMHCAARAYTIILTDAMTCL
jgi:hypothetical protein